MSGNIDPYDVMQCERTVSEFIEPHIESETKDSILIKQIDKTREAIDRYFKEESLDFTYPVIYTTILGKTLQNLDGIPVVSPDGNEIERSVDSVFAERLLKEQNLWEVQYELDVATFCHSSGLKTKLIHEGTESGSDILVELDGTRIDIECKRRRTISRDDENSEIYSIIEERVVDQIDQNDDSYYIEISSDGPFEEQAVDEVIDLVVTLIEEKCSKKESVVNEVTYRAKLKDYFSGVKESDVSKRDVERWIEYNIMSPPMIYALLSPFDIDGISPSMRIRSMIMFKSERKTISKNTLALDFNFPEIEEDYFDRFIEGTVKRGMDDLSGRSPSVLFAYLPAQAKDDMEQYHIEGLEEPIPQIKRLEQRIEGKLNISSSVNAIVLSTSYFNPEQESASIQQGFKVFENPSPERKLPSDFFNSLFDL